MVLLTNEDFLGQLAAFYFKSREGGSRSVSVTMKPHDGRTKAMPRNASFSRSATQCLFRASYGNKKISTAVAPKDVNKFVTSYSQLLRANMDNLKKAEKANEEKKQKKKEKQAAATVKA